MRIRYLDTQFALAQVKFVNRSSTIYTASSFVIPCGRIQGPSISGRWAFNSGLGLVGISISIRLGIRPEFQNFGQELEC